VLQIIEPLNIWVGLPLTVVVFFIDKIAAMYKAAMMQLRGELAGTVREWGIRSILRS
jgi:hypothetical protein